MYATQVNKVGLRLTSYYTLTYDNIKYQNNKYINRPLAHAGCRKRPPWCCNNSLYNPFKVGNHMLGSTATVPP